jgi:hypothetical protein
MNRLLNLFVNVASLAVKQAQVMRASRLWSRSTVVPDA